MKKGRYSKHIIILSFILAFIFTALISCGRGCFLKDRAVPSTANTEKKFRSVSDWIPPTANFILLADIYKIVNANPESEFIKTNYSKIFRYLNSPDFNLKSEIGMFVVIFEIAPQKNIKGPILLIQGGFDKEKILPKILEQVSKDGLAIAPQDYNGFTIYEEIKKEDDQLNPQAFTILSNGIIGAGTAEHLKWLIDNKSAENPNLEELCDGLDFDLPISGKMIFSDELSKSLPKPINSISKISVEANITSDLSGKIIVDVRKDGDIKKLVSTLEGLKAVEAIRYLNNSAMLMVVEKITISEKDGKILIEIPDDLKIIKLLSS